MIHPKHLHPARHVFHGHATGVAAHIRRPGDAAALHSSAALPVIGGHYESKVGPKRIGKWASFQSAHTSVHGDYVDERQGVATTRGKVAFHRAPTATRVAGRVRGLDILGRVQIADMSLGLIASSARGKGQPSIRLEGNRIKGVTIDGAQLKITLAEDFYSKHDTHEKLRKAHKKLPEQHARMFLPARAGDEKVISFPEANGTVKCTIVQKMEWVGKPHRNAKIHGHVVELPGFGSLYFGEMLLTGNSRRLTILRCQLGSPVGGEFMALDGGSNGDTFPPTGGG
jgi:hypothetical protein